MATAAVSKTESAKAPTVTCADAGIRERREHPWPTGMCSAARSADTHSGRVMRERSSASASARRVMSGWCCSRAGSGTRSRAERRHRRGSISGNASCDDGRCSHHSFGVTFVHQGQQENQHDDRTLNTSEPRIMTANCLLPRAFCQAHWRKRRSVG